MNFHDPRFRQVQTIQYLTGRFDSARLIRWHIPCWGQPRAASMAGAQALAQRAPFRAATTDTSIDCDEY